MKCGVLDCKRAHSARGLCAAHYMQIRMGKATTEVGLRTKVRPVRPHPTDRTLALVELPRGHWAIVDAADAGDVGRFNWSRGGCSGRTYYATRRWTEDGRQRSVSLHRFVGDLMGIPREVEVDHKDGNGLDCTRGNLRGATHQQNMMNKGISASNTSGVIGVSRGRRDGTWAAEIKANGRRFRKTFHSFEEAVIAVTKKRAEFHGEFARN